MGVAAALTSGYLRNGYPTCIEHVSGYPFHWHGNDLRGRITAYFPALAGTHCAYSLRLPVCRDARALNAERAECRPHIWPECVTCRPTQVNTPHLNPSQIERYSIYVPQRDGRLSWPRWLVTYRDGLPTHRQSAIQVLTQQHMARSCMCNLSITSPMP